MLTRQGKLALEEAKLLLQESEELVLEKLDELGLTYEQFTILKRQSFKVQ